MPDGVDVNGKYALLFYYVARGRIAREISESGVLTPSKDGERYLSEFDARFSRPRVDLTDVKPEEGKSAIAAATGLPRSQVNYGLEVLVEKERVVPALPHLPRTYQVFSEEPVPVRVVMVHNMDRIERGRARGHSIERFIGQNGFPYAHYVAAQATR